MDITYYELYILTSTIFSTDYCLIFLFPRDDDIISENNICGLCTQNVSSKEEMVSCISPKCRAISHITCLAQHFRQTTQEKNRLDYILPIDGTCPVCDFHCLWGDIVKKKKGFFEDLPFKVGSSDEELLDSDN